jgi:8-oxo-dGTP pyrophosphatase MutT (NUDIX family)
MPSSPNVIHQAGVIALHADRICVISSRGGKRWVVPKGCLEPGKTAAEIALQEAWEEAGLAGVLQPDPLGSYLYEKSGFLCHVTVFVMSVTDVAERWPERQQRERCWLDVEQALQRIDDAGLRQLIREAMTVQS